MQIPYVIDNQRYVLADVLNAILAEYVHRSLDIATAYFNTSGFNELRGNLSSLNSFRLLLGFEPTNGPNRGLRLDSKTIHTLLRADLEREPISANTMALVEDLISFLHQPHVLA